MKNQLNLGILVSALALIGAGCAPAAPAPEPGTDSQKAEEAASRPSTETEDEARKLVTNVAIDETWKTYVNESLSFEFKWPTQGRYAPQWDVTFVAENDAKVMSGCRVTSPVTNDVQEKVMVGDVEFCHTFTTDTGGSIDYYVTKNGPRYVVITFTKAVVSADQAAYSWDEYRVHLGQIVSTFRYLK